MVVNCFMAFSFFGLFRKEQKGHPRPAGRLCSDKMYAVERIPLTDPEVQYPFYLLISNRACLYYLVSHSEASL